MREVNIPEMDSFVEADKIMDGDAVSVVGHDGMDILAVILQVRTTRFKFSLNDAQVLPSEEQLRGAQDAG